jgi:GT2 family glycosyltransferase/glycosyltransferase involved in cell wall biosynthesis
LAAPLRHGNPRPDVEASFPFSPNARSSGFSGHLNLDAGGGPVYLSAKLASGDTLQEQLIPMLDISDQQLAQARRSASYTRAKRIKLPTSPAPVISIIIPIFNQLDLTLGCLESLVRHAGPTPFEVIIIDDNSVPLVRDTLGLVHGLRLISNVANQGFIYNCNLGAQKACGEYVLFLNNDTEVSAGWLEAMRQVFFDRPQAGAVGAKLIYPDGRLQEAGGIIFEDASGINYGKNDNPDRPEYNYLRKVDYCSGACLLVPRDLFLGVGGFDVRFRPAYYEDVDLAFTIRAVGREVYYQPAACVIHFEGVSSGTDTRTGIKIFQDINQAKFAAKWATALAGHGIDASIRHVARDRFAAARILVIDACALTPDADSGSQRMFNLLHLLAQQGAKVTFAAQDLQTYEPYSTLLRLAGIEHLSAPYVSDLAQYIETYGYIFDVIILSRNHIAQQFIETVRRLAPEARIVFDTVDLMFLRLERQAAHESSLALKEESVKCMDVELSLCARADIVFVVSTAEARLLEQYIPRRKIFVVSNIHMPNPGHATFEERSGIVFVGSYQHPPNVDAVDFLFDSILPLVHKRLPELGIHIVGSKMPKRWQAHATKHVHLHGHMADLNPLYQQVRIAIAPLRYGAGVKGKINQAMAYGVPVVATTIAVEGMHLVGGKDVLIADSPVNFADAIVRLHEDRELWQQISREGIVNIERHFSFAAAEKELRKALGLSLFAGKHGALPRRPPTLYQLGSHIDFGQTGTAWKYTREGWGEPDATSCWMVGPKAVIELKLSDDVPPKSVRAIFYPFLAPPHLSRQRLELAVNNRSLSPVIVEAKTTEPAEVRWEIPEDLLYDSRRITLTFHSPDAAPPRSLSTSSDTRKLSFAFLMIELSS